MYEHHHKYMSTLDSETDTCTCKQCTCATNKYNKTTLVFFLLNIGAGNTSTLILLELRDDAVGGGDLTRVGLGLLVGEQSEERLGGHLLGELHHVIVSCDDVSNDCEEPVIPLLFLLHI